MIQIEILFCRHCEHVFKWYDERCPNYCPECGHENFQSFLVQIKEYKR